MAKYDPDEFFHHKRQTNYDAIRNMSVEEMAEWLEEHCYQYGWLDWLQQEVAG